MESLMKKLTEQHNPKPEPWLIRLLKAPFRFHDYDLENPRCINNESLDKDVTGEPRVLLYFVAFCKNCGKPIQVNRESYLVPIPWHKRWFCFHKPKAYKLHQEQALEREAEMMSMGMEDYQQFDRLLDTGLSMTELSDKVRTAVRLRNQYQDIKEE